MGRDIFSRAPFIAAGGAFFLFMDASAASLLFLLMILLCEIVLLTYVLQIEGTRFASKRFRRPANEVREIALLFSIGFLAIAATQIGLSINNARRSLGIPKDNLQSLRIVILVDPGMMNKREWVAEGQLIESASTSVRAEARGRLIVAGKGEAAGIGAGRILTVYGNLSGMDGTGPMFLYLSDYRREKFLSPVYAFRFRVINVINGRLERTSYDTYTFLAALLLGRKIDPGSPVIRRFRFAGCLHLLALSGFHVGLLAAAIRFIGSKLFGVKAGFALSVLIVVLYLFLVGFRPSLLRAVIMYILWSRNRFLGRHSAPLGILSLTFLVQTAVFPRSVDSLSFQLSYAALFGILTGGRSLAIRLSRVLPVPAAGVLGMGIGAQAAALPIVMRNFGLWRPAAIIAAGILTPFIAGSMALGSALIVLPDGPAAEFTVHLLEGLVALMARTADLFTGIPALNLGELIPWPLAILGTILPLFHRSPKRAVEPRLPSLNPQLPRISGHRAS